MCGGLFESIGGGGGQRLTSGTHRLSVVWSERCKEDVSLWTSRLCWTLGSVLEQVRVPPQPRSNLLQPQFEKTFSWKPHRLNITCSSNVPLYKKPKKKKTSFKEKYWEMGLFISFNLFCHIFVKWKIVNKTFSIVSLSWASIYLFLISTGNGSTTLRRCK